MRSYHCLVLTRFPLHSPTSISPHSLLLSLISYALKSTVMGFSNWLVLAITHPLEFRTLLQFHIYHETKRDITSVKEHETSGWSRETMRKCWGFLDMTSRSFSAVIKELDGDLARTVSIWILSAVDVSDTWRRYACSTWCYVAWTR